MSTHITDITADPTVPAVRITRTFDASPEQLFRAHTDPEILRQWLGPRDLEMEVLTFDCRTGGEYRYVHRRTGDDGLEEYFFHGCFHLISPRKLVQTFTFEGYPDAVALETMTFEAAEAGRSMLQAVSLVDSFEGRDGMLASGMNDGINQGYERLDALLASGAL